MEYKHYTAADIADHILNACFSMLQPTATGDLAYAIGVTADGLLTYADVDEAVVSFIIPVELPNGNEDDDEDAMYEFESADNAEFMLICKTFADLINSYHDYK